MCVFSFEAIYDMFYYIINYKYLVFHNIQTYTSCTSYYAAKHNIPYLHTYYVLFNE